MVGPVLGFVYLIGEKEFLRGGQRGLFSPFLKKFVSFWKKKIIHFFFLLLWGEKKFFLYPKPFSEGGKKKFKKKIGKKNQKIFFFFFPFSPSFPIFFSIGLLPVALPPRHFWGIPGKGEGFLKFFFGAPTLFFFFQGGGEKNFLWGGAILRTPT